LFEPDPAPGVACFLFEERGVAKGAHGSVVSFLRTHARSEVLSNLLFEMKLNFVV
jgi:hypothetical protein